MDYFTNAAFEHSEFSRDYNIDLVFCVDCSRSMAGIMETVRRLIHCFSADLERLFVADDVRRIAKMRAKFIAFGGYSTDFPDNAPVLLTDFYTLPAESENFSKAASMLRAGLDLPGGKTSGLEALGFAIRSDWNTQGIMGRHIIVLFTDKEPHTLGFGKASPFYPCGMAKDFNELESWWGVHQESDYISTRKKRLILFAPDKGAWSTISDTWDNVIHYTVALNNGMADASYQQILDAIFFL